MDIAIKPLKRKAKAIGGVIAVVLKKEPDSVNFSDYIAKAETWLLILKEMNEGEKNEY